MEIGKQNHTSCYQQAGVEFIREGCHYHLKCTLKAMKITLTNTGKQLYLSFQTDVSSRHDEDCFYLKETCF